MVGDKNLHGDEDAGDTCEEIAQDQHNERAHGGYCGEGGRWVFVVVAFTLALGIDPRSGQILLLLHGLGDTVGIRGGLATVILDLNEHFFLSLRGK